MSLPPRYIDCPTCGAFSVSAEFHRCPPIWLAWCPQNGETEDDARKIHALDAGDAAEKWAERSDSDSAEYSIVGGSDVTVYVRKADETAISRWSVSGEAVPSYSATEIV